MWKAPNRAKHEITQAFNDGLVRICTVENTAAPGYQPKAGLKTKINLRYANQRLGINRIYLSKQAMAEVVKVIRVPIAAGIDPQDIAVTEDGTQYRIESVQSVQEVYPPSCDISLSIIRQRFEVEA